MARKVMTKKYLISGINISDSGVGRLMKNLAPQAKSHGYEIIALRSNKSIKKIISQKSIAGVIGEISGRIFGRIFSKPIYFFRFYFLKNAKIIFLHPQTAGFGNLMRLARRNSVYLYVMDNSFFCIRSYNFNPESEAECLRCIHAPEEALDQCQPFPVDMNKTRNQEWLKELLGVSGRVIFLAQNNKQRELLMLHFGNDVRVEVVGLDTGELGGDLISVRENCAESTELKWDIVFHGAPHLAKGLKYFIEIAERLPMYTAFVPSDRGECERVLGRKIHADNILFLKCNWESGLQSAVQSSKIVFNPSLWSAPIEGALIKSMYYGNVVATVATEYGFEGELDFGDGLLRLPRDIQAATAVVLAKLERYEIPPKKKAFVHEYKKINFLFDTVESA